MTEMFRRIKDVVTQYWTPASDDKTKTMTPDETSLVIPSLSIAGCTLKLPPCKQAVGRFYRIFVRARSGSGAITLSDQDDSENWSNKTLDATGDYIFLRTDEAGEQWCVVENGIA